MATMLVEHFKGVVPDTIEQLETLPGVGHKTASVVICQVRLSHNPSSLSHQRCFGSNCVLAAHSAKPLLLLGPHPQYLTVCPQ